MKEPGAFDLVKLHWKIAQRCHSGACVQVAEEGALIFLGDSKNPAGPALAYSRPEWQDFLDRIKRGDLDLF